MIRFRIINFLLVIGLIAILLGLFQTVKHLNSADVYNDFFQAIEVSPSGDFLATKYQAEDDLLILDKKLNLVDTVHVRQRFSHNSEFYYVTDYYFSNSETLTIVCAFEGGTSILDYDLKTRISSERIIVADGYGLSGDQWITSDSYVNHLQVYGMDQRFKFELRVIHPSLRKSDSTQVFVHRLPGKEHILIERVHSSNVRDHQLWDLSTKRPIWTKNRLDAISDSTHFVVLRFRGNADPTFFTKLVVEDTGTGRSWTEDRIWRFLAFSNDENLCAITKYDFLPGVLTRIEFRDSRNGEFLGSIKRAYCSRAAFGPDSDTLYIALPPKGGVHAGGRIEVWDWRAGRMIHRFGEFRPVWRYAGAFWLAIAIWCTICFFFGSAVKTKKPFRAWLNVIVSLTAFILMANLARLMFHWINPNFYENIGPAILVSATFFAGAFAQQICKCRNTIILGCHFLIQVVFFGTVIFMVYVYDDGRILATIWINQSVLLSLVGVQWINEIWWREPARALN